MLVTNCLPTHGVTMCCVVDFPQILLRTRNTSAGELTLERTTTQSTREARCNGLLPTRCSDVTPAWMESLTRVRQSNSGVCNGAVFFCKNVHFVFLATLSTYHSLCKTASSDYQVEHFSHRGSYLRQVEACCWKMCVIGFAVV